MSHIPDSYQLLIFRYPPFSKVPALSHPIPNQDQPAACTAFAGAMKRANRQCLQYLDMYMHSYNPLAPLFRAGLCHFAPTVRQGALSTACFCLHREMQQLLFGCEKRLSSCLKVPVY